MSLSFQFVRTRRGIATLCALLILALFLARPEVNRLRARLVSSISAALGRRVEVSSVTLRFLPQPGFGLSDFVVHDDPAFGAEPILRAQEVTAVLRVTSLLRGRLEISRLSLTEPSLNLARNSQGHWNLEDLVERAAKIPVAPTGKARTESRPGFPYIEASDGRINFKLGEEKKSFALTGADFSLWQESENAWGARLKAQPIRTDFNATDTGLLRVEGSWQRADSLRETPLQFSAQWESAQLGQFSRLFSGNDKGWRGTVALSLQLAGKPADLVISASASIEDFHRYDIMGGDSLRLAGQCRGRYSSVDWRLSDIACRAPVGTGMVSVDGSLIGLLPPRTYDLSVGLHDIAVPSVLTLLRNSKKDIPEDLAASGKLDADLALQRQDQAGATAWGGAGQITGFRMVSRSNSADVALDRIPFTLGANPDDSGPRVDIGPLRVALGGAAPVRVHGTLALAGYRLQMQGDARVKRLLQLARAIGVPAAQPSADGSATVALQVAGMWAGFAPPLISGRAQLSGVQADVRGVNAPLEISAATVFLRQDNIGVQNLSAAFAGSTWRGSLLLPRHCVRQAACPIQFDLRTRELAGDKLIQLFNLKPPKRPWYRFLSSRPGTSYLATLTATGNLTADRVLIHKLRFDEVSARAVIHEGRVQLDNFEADAFGGKHDGVWKADFSSRPPQFSGQGSLRRIALAQIAQAMNDGWVAGTASATYQVSASGANGEDFLSSLEATLDVKARDTTFTHLVLLPGAGALRAERFAGQVSFHEGKLEIRQGTLATAGGIYQIAGTASRGRSLDLHLLRAGSRGFAITGTLAEPHVVQAATPETQAALKP